MSVEYVKHAIAGPMLGLSVKNLGPIENGDITLKPLTVLLGPNNSGKSHVAKLIHSVIKCETMVDTPRFLHFDPPRDIKESIRRMGKDADDGRMSRSNVATDLMRLYMSDFFPKV